MEIRELLTSERQKNRVSDTSQRSVRLKQGRGVGQTSGFYIIEVDLWEFGNFQVLIPVVPDNCNFQHHETRHSALECRMRIDVRSTLGEILVAIQKQKLLELDMGQVGHVRRSHCTLFLTQYTIKRSIHEEYIRIERHHPNTQLKDHLRSFPRYRGVLARRACYVTAVESIELYTPEAFVSSLKICHVDGYYVRNDPSGSLFPIPSGAFSSFKESMNCFKVSRGSLLNYSLSTSTCTWYF